MARPEPAKLLSSWLQRQMLNLQCHLGRIEQGIVDEAMAYRIVDPLPMLVANSRRNFHLDVKVTQSRRIRGFLGGDSNDRTFCRQVMFFEVLRRIESRT